MNLYSMYDRLAESFSDPFCAETDAAAIRAVKLSPPFQKLTPRFADEYRLYYIGTHDRKSGLVYGDEHPRAIDIAEGDK